MLQKQAARLLILSVLLAISSIFQMGYSNAYPNTAFNSFRLFLNNSEHGSLTDNEFNWIWSGILNVYFIGFIAGSVAAVPLADHIGRKWCLVFGNTTNFLAASLSTVSVLWLLPSLFVIGRIIFAVGAGISMNSLVLLLQVIGYILLKFITLIFISPFLTVPSESAPVALRGLMSFNAEMAFVVTNMFGALAGMRAVLGTKIGWLVGLASIPAFCSVLMALYFPDSPRFLLLKRKKRRMAEKAMVFYQGTDEQETNKILLTFEKEATESKGTIKELLHTHHLRSGLFLGVVALQATTSIWPIIYYSTDFLIRENIDATTAELTSTLMLFVSCIATAVGMLIVEQQPRRRLLLTCGFTNMSALTLFVVCSQLERIWKGSKYGCIVAVVLHGISYSIALGPISWFITAELVPLQHRALSQSVALSLNQAIALILCFVTLPLYDGIGSLVLLPLFVIPGMMAMFYLLCNLPETRSRHIDEIVLELSGDDKIRREMRPQAERL